MLDRESAVELLQRAADTLETLLSADPDMPTYQADYDAADDLLKIIRWALDAPD